MYAAESDRVSCTVVVSPLGLSSKTECESLLAHSLGAVVDSSLGVPTPSSTSDIVRTMSICIMGSKSSSSNISDLLSIEKESVRSLLNGLGSLAVLVGVGRYVTSSIEEVESRFGPLNMNAAGDTKSMLGTDPRRDDLRLDAKLEALDSG
jgi:hypothetical protein